MYCINSTRRFHTVSTNYAVPPWWGTAKGSLALTSCSPLAHSLALLRSFVLSLTHWLAPELMNLTQRFHTVSTHCAVPSWQGTAKGSLALTFRSRLAHSLALLRSWGNEGMTPEGMTCFSYPSHIIQYWIKTSNLVRDIGWILIDARPKMMMMMIMMMMMMLWLSSIHGSIMPLQDRKKRMLIDRDREI